MQESMPSMSHDAPQKTISGTRDIEHGAHATLTFLTHQQVHTLYHIHKRLILPVLDVRSSPRSSSCSLNGDSRGVFPLWSSESMCESRLDCPSSSRDGQNIEGRLRTTAISDLIPSVVMYILRVSISEFWGYPKSRISTHRGE